MPTRGSIRLAGEEITALPGWRLAELRNRTIGFVFQFHHLCPSSTPLENVMMPGLVQGRSKRELETRAARAARRGGAQGARPRTARASSPAASSSAWRSPAPCCSSRSCCSPTSRRATSTRRRALQIHDLFFAINKQRGTTIVVVTHNPALAASMPRVVTLRDGRVEKDERRDVDNRTPTRSAGSRLGWRELEAGSTSGR